MQPWIAFPAVHVERHDAVLAVFGAADDDRALPRRDPNVADLETLLARSPAWSIGVISTVSFPSPAPAWRQQGVLQVFVRPLGHRLHLVSQRTLR
jgi:hypothetical protein